MNDDVYVLLKMWVLDRFLKLPFLISYQSGEIQKKRTVFKFALIHYIAKTKYHYLQLKQKHIAGIIFSFIKLSLLFQAAYSDWIYQL